MSICTSLIRQTDRQAHGGPGEAEGRVRDWEGFLPPLSKPPLRPSLTAFLRFWEHFLVAQTMQKWWLQRESVDLGTWAVFPRPGSGTMVTQGHPGCLTSLTPDSCPEAPPGQVRDTDGKPGPQRGGCVECQALCARSRAVPKASPDAGPEAPGKAGCVMSSHRLTGWATGSQGQAGMHVPFPGGAAHPHPSPSSLAFPGPSCCVVTPQPPARARRDA